MLTALRSTPLLLALTACQPAGETGAPNPDPCIADTTWALHQEIGSVVRVSWTQACAGEGRVEYRFDADSWEATPRAQRGEGEHEQLLLGVPYDHKLQLRVVVERDDGVTERGETQAALTDPLPSAVLEPVLLLSETALQEPTGRWLLGSMNTTMPGWQSGVFYTFILDRHGRVVWARETPDQHFTLQVRPANDGASVLVDETTWWSMWDFDKPGQVHRVTLDGTVLDSREIPDANHPYTELPDGRLAWWAMPGEGEGQLRILEDDGSSELIWSCTSFMKQLGYQESCLANTVSWRESDQSFLVSLALQHLVVHLDAASGEVLRLFGQHEQAWGFDPPESGFWLQHGVAFTDTGSLLLSSHASEEDEEGVVREYVLDDEAQVLEQIWSYGEGLGVEAGLGGEAQRLPGGNTLHNYGTTPRVKEITPGGELAWDLMWETDRLLGRTTWVEELYPLLGE